jgi:hypothetical protein
MSENILLYVVTIILVGLIITSGKFSKSFRLFNIIVLLVYSIPLYYAFFYKGGGGSGFLWWFYLIVLILLQIVVITGFFISKYLKKLLPKIKNRQNKQKNRNDT